MSNYVRIRPNPYHALSEAPDEVTIPLGIMGIAFAVGMIIWLSRGGVDKLPLKRTRASDYA